MILRGKVEFHGREYVDPPPVSDVVREAPSVFQLSSLFGGPDWALEKEKNRRKIAESWGVWIWLVADFIPDGKFLVKVYLLVTSNFSNHCFSAISHNNLLADLSSNIYQCFACLIIMAMFWSSELMLLLCKSRVVLKATIHFRILLFRITFLPLSWMSFDGLKFLVVSLS